MSRNKKLSLEERLSLAAKKGKKKTKKQASPTVKADTTSPEPQDIISQEENPVDHTEEEEDKQQSKVEPTVEISEITDELELQEGEALNIKYLNLDWLPKDYQQCNITTVLNKIDPYIKDIVENNKKSKDTLLKTINDKDELILQLRKEGDNLSKTEFKKCNQIKVLKDKVYELETDSISLEGELSDKIKDCETLQNNLNELQEKVSDSNVTITKLKNEVKDNGILQNTINEKDVQVIDLTSELKTIRETLTMEKRTLDDELTSLKTSTSIHISTLETDLEQLKIKLDNKEHNGGVDGESPHLENIDRYKMLETQFDSSKENWKSIETSLNNKIVNLEENFYSKKLESEIFERTLKNVQSENSILQNELSAEKDKSKSLDMDINGANELIDTLQHTSNELKDDYNLLQKKYDIQKSQLSKNYSMEQPVEQNMPSISAKYINNNLPQNISDEWILPADDSLSSLRDDISVSSTIEEDKLDESNIDISIGIPDDAENLSLFLHGNSTERSRSNLSLGVYNKFNRANSPVFPNAKNKLGRQVSNSNNNTEVNVNNSSGAMNTNSGLVPRLGAEVRRLENELMNMKESQENIIKDKNNANEEILRLLNENETVCKINNENSDLRIKVTDLQNHLEVSLQLLGEKTETVEELQNDVNDLKDMIKQQVQQMIEIQEQK